MSLTFWELTLGFASAWQVAGGILAHPTDPMDCSDPEPLTRASVYASLSDPDNVFHFSDLLEAVSKRPELKSELADVLNIFAYGNFSDYAGPWGRKRLQVD